MNIASQLIGVGKRLADAPAITDRGTTVDYGTFAERASRIGGGFRTAGLAPGDRVVLCMENCRAFFEVLYGCWVAGLCAVPTNAKLHPREVQHIVENSQARICVTTAGLAQSLLPVMPEGVRLIVADDADYEKLAAAEAIAVADRRPEDPAWIFYTSGTTGRPKGALLSHRALLFMSHCYYADIDFVEPTDTKLHAAPLSHASGLYALPHVAKGSHHIIMGHFDPGEIFAAIETLPNVTLFGAPTMVSRLVRAAETSRPDTRNLKTLYYGGGPMYVADTRRALELFGPKLYQLFGQGESPMTITGLSKLMHARTDHPRYDELLASTGYPRTGVEVRVVDQDDRDVPFGEVGEVITRSDCMMLEYWRNPEATADTLRGGWLHTGDLGALDESGFLTLRDRSKDMIISGGSNIYPREIEEVLLRNPAVVEASVVGRPHADWGEEVVAFVVAKPGEAVSQSELDALCLEHIARFKRPKHYRFVESLPKNNYGKVLKTELRQRLTEEEKAR